MHKLSIIVPCYNCENTLEQAVNSCYAEKNISPFEIVMVDDGSTDGTRALMEDLAKKHSEIKLVFHEKNMGGGAARNTGIRSSDGKFIYCLDSDNFFDGDSLAKMIKFIEEADVDGTVFQEQKFFHGNDSKKYESLINSIMDRPFTINDLYGEKTIMVDNFVMTRNSYMKTTGYPEHHGFDTQGFEVRYISAGNKIRVCPDTIFYHRTISKDSSYFERVYNNGELSKNYYLIFEEVFDMLSEKAKDILVNYDIFKNTSSQNNLFKEIKKLAKTDELFSKEKSPSSKFNDYSKAIAKYKSGHYKEALDFLQHTITHGSLSKVEFFTILRCYVGLSGTPKKDIEKETLNIISGLQLEKRTLYKPYQRIYILNKIAKPVRKLLNYFKKKTK